MLTSGILYDELRILGFNIKVHFTNLLYEVKTSLPKEMLGFKI
ncbi:MAG: hypothetical protein RBS11_04840 [Sulfurimonas sp.]|nr:hypothetical protein [Sulfurimonas sp.]